jgi:hypothetical protein
MAGRAYTHYTSDLISCSELQINDKSSLEACRSRSEKEFRSGLYSGFDFAWDEGEFWSYKGYFRHMGWELVLMIVIPPVLIYLLAWVVTAFCLWIWRGFGSVPGRPGPGTA